MKGLQLEIEMKLRSSQVHQDKLTAILLAIQEHHAAVKCEMYTKMDEFKKIISEIENCLKTIGSNLCNELYAKTKRFESDRVFYQNLLNSLKENNKILNQILLPLRIENSPPVQKTPKLQKAEQNNPEASNPKQNITQSISLFHFNDDYFQKGIEAMADQQNTLRQIEDCIYKDYYALPLRKDANWQKSSYLAEIFAILHKMVATASRKIVMPGNYMMPAPTRKNITIQIQNRAAPASSNMLLSAKSTMITSASTLTPMGKLREIMRLNDDPRRRSTIGSWFEEGLNKTSRF